MVESTGSPERGIERVWSISGSNDDNGLVVGLLPRQILGKSVRENGSGPWRSQLAIHAGQKLRDDASLHFALGAFTFRRYCVDLVNK